MALKNFCYNPDKKSVLGRTAKSWLLIFVFYLIFFSLLICFFMGMMSVFMYSYIKVDIPSLTGKQSLLRLSPGITALPRIRIEDSFIQLTKRAGSSRNTDYLNAINNFLLIYENQDVQTCNNPLDANERSCKFNTNSLGNCKNPAEALSKMNPCFYLKLNKIYGWIPDYKNETKKITVTCTGLNPLDTQLLGKPVYYPSAGGDGGEIPSVFFPYLGRKDYQPPIVAVQFPEMKKNVLIIVECSLHNVAVDEEMKVSFEIAFDT
ncbi:Atp1b1p [Cichlidogyrus casuarinus]|uniref:Atp1b1p n=1 Tax=Cichlidogyrus casuarinus TaxID=1844966 RepID=A0ABD2PW97_9PLAT